MSIIEKIEKAINKTPHDSFLYTDTSDGFIHQSYSGLVEAVYEALLEEYPSDSAGEINVSQSIVDDFVFEMI